MKRNLSLQAPEPKPEPKNNDTLARWKEALAKVQEAQNLAVFGETLGAETELTNVLDELRSVAEETQGVFRACSVA